MEKSLEQAPINIATENNLPTHSSDQNSMKIKISVASKFLLLIAMLLILLISSLLYTAASMFTEDKKKYVFDSQATQSKLVGKEFVNKLQSGLDTIRVSMGYSDFKKPVEGNIKEQLNFLVNNQSNLIGMSLRNVNPETMSAVIIFRHFMSTQLESIKITEEELRLEDSFLQKIKDKLLKDGLVFINNSKSGMTPVLAMIYADLETYKTKKYLPVAVGYYSLDSYYKSDIAGFNKLAILDKYGDLLFHSDKKEIYSKINFSSDEIFNEATKSSIANGAKEYINTEKVRTLSSFYKPGLGITVINSIEYNKAMKATYTLNEKFVKYGIGALGIMLIIGLIFSKRIVRPLQTLFSATSEVSRGNFDIAIPVTSKDEIGVLTSAFVTMSHKISDLVKQMVDKVRVDQELQIAKTVQQSLFPPELIETECVLVASHYQSASECGGDWWGFFNQNNKHVIAIADATGHGLPSALMTASARSCFSVIEKLITSSSVEMNPAQMLSIANRVVYDSAQGKIMMTFFVAVIDSERKTIQYANAGHNPPWLFSKQSDGAVKSVSFIAKGQRLGEARETEDFELREVSYQPNDLFVCYTDGLIEGKNTNGDQYGKKQARKILESVVQNQPTEIVQTLINGFLSFNGTKPLDDDVTLAIARLKA